MPADLARQMARLALCAWPGLAARHAILDVIGSLDSIESTWRDSVFDTDTRSPML